MTRIAGFPGEFLWELDIATRHILSMAEAFPADAYDWYPDPRARSVSEVFVHIATGNYLLLDLLGVPVPADLYPHLPPASPDPSAASDRFSAFLRANDELVASIREKAEVIALLQPSFAAVEAAFRQTSERDLDGELDFAGEPSTVRRVYLRLLTHNHEHMGQMTAYLRCNNIAPPWPDLRRPRDAEQRVQH
jgi:uncharacterized damage-inducible protein DinB